VVWEKVFGTRFVVVSEFVFPDEKIQTVLQNFLFCRWRQKVKMSHLYLSPKLHGVTSQKIVTEIYMLHVSTESTLWPPEPLIFVHFLFRINLKSISSCIIYSFASRRKFRVLAL